MQRSSERLDVTQTMLGNTLPIQPHCVYGCLYSTEAENPSVTCYLEPFADDDDARADGSVDVSSSVGVHGKTFGWTHHVAGVPLYTELHRDDQIRTSTDPPSSMKTCPSAASVLSYARSDTDSSANGPTCRICDSAGDGSNRLISPCRCSGTSKFVHEQCLNVSTHLFRLISFTDVCFLSI